VSLGGRRHEVRKVLAHNESKTTERKGAMKTSGGLELATGVFGGRFGFGKDKGQSHSLANNTSVEGSGGGVRVIGGNELRYEE
jgi:hypothetical protein